jgi:hypothetical protein
MPLIRKVISLRTCKAVVIPKDWLEYYERELGHPIEEVAIEVDRVLTIAPLIPKEKREQGRPQG